MPILQNMWSNVLWQFYEAKGSQFSFLKYVICVHEVVCVGCLAFFAAYWYDETWMKLRVDQCTVSAAGVAGWADVMSHPFYLSFIT